MLFALCLVSLWSCGESLSLMVTGDVNLNPNLPSFAIRNASYIWNDFIDELRGVDLLAINHESTLASIATSDPNIIQFEDPLDYLAAYGPEGAGVDFITQANNHQYDFGNVGMKNTVQALQGMGIPWGGLGATASDVRKPVVVTTKSGVRVAFFTMVVDVCWINNNGTLFLDGCTCGANAGPPPAYQCYEAGTSQPLGLWYQWLITDEFVQNVTQIIGDYKQANPQDFVVTYLHCGPNFQWQPYPDRETLLRSIAKVSNLVWGTSSHHIQRFEVVGQTPIIYGLGDLLFRHVPGVDDYCPDYAIPCEQFRPELALAYQFEIVSDGKGLPVVDLERILAYPTTHDDFQIQQITWEDSSELYWLEKTFNELSPGWALTFDNTRNRFNVTKQ